MTKKMMTMMCVAGCAFAAQAADDEAVKSAFSFTPGADVRARYEYKDNWPNKGKATTGTAYEEYLRLRTRIWGKAAFGDALTGFVRLGNEFREYRDSPSNRNRNEFPDELYIDNLWLQWKTDAAQIKIGRQELKLGAGRLVADGTPGDGSRSTFFDAVAVRFDVLSKSAVELIGTYNHYRDDATLGDARGGVYDMTKLKSGSPYSEMDESGVMVYAHLNEFDALPTELYWIWKNETRFYDKDKRYPGRDFHTAGLRIRPALSETLSCEIEAAYQFGGVDSAEDMKSRDISAYMLFGGITAKLPESAIGTPKVSAACLYLSGDSESWYKTADGGTDSGWNPVFNRSSWLGEIPSGMYDQSRWSNLIYPHLDATLDITKRHRLNLQTGPMYAAKKDNDADDCYRGYFTKARYSFPLFHGDAAKFNGAVAAEMMNYGDYYESPTDDAYWLRFEITATF